MNHGCLELLWGAKRPQKTWLRDMGLFRDLHLTSFLSLEVFYLPLRIG